MSFIAGWLHVLHGVRIRICVYDLCVCVCHPGHPSAFFHYRTCRHDVHTPNPVTPSPTPATEAPYVLGAAFEVRACVWTYVYTFPVFTLRVYTLRIFAPSTHFYLRIICICRMCVRECSNCMLLLLCAATHNIHTHTHFNGISAQRTFTHNRCLLNDTVACTCTPSHWIYYCIISYVNMRHWHSPQRICE